MNNKQREEYFRDEANWEEIGNIPPVVNLITATPIIRVSKLIGYPIVKIRVRLDLGIGEKTLVTKGAVLGYYNCNGIAFNEIYQKTVNQCIDIMRAIDNESKNALK